MMNKCSTIYEWMANKLPTNQQTNYEQQPKDGHSTNEETHEQTN